MVIQKYKFFQFTIIGSVEQRDFESNFVKGPTVDCEDDILIGINILWALDLYVDVCL